MPEAAEIFRQWSGYLKPEDLTQIESAKVDAVDLQTTGTLKLRKAGDPAEWKTPRSARDNWRNRGTGGDSR